MGAAEWFRGPRAGQGVLDCARIFKYFGVRRVFEQKRGGVETMLLLFVAYISHFQPAIPSFLWPHGGNGNSVGGKHNFDI